MTRGSTSTKAVPRSRKRRKTGPYLCESSNEEEAVEAAVDDEADDNV